MDKSAQISAIAVLQNQINVFVGDLFMRESHKEKKQEKVKSWSEWTCEALAGEME